MARIRTIKPEFWSSEQVMECSTNARLLFVGLWNFCDDYGRHPLSARQIKALVFPGDPFTSANVQGMLDELSSNGLIVPYTIDNKEYLQVTGWRHQKIDRPQAPKYPGMVDETSSNNQRAFVEHSRLSTEPITHKGTQNKKEPPAPKAEPSPPTASPSLDFDRLLKSCNEALGTQGVTDPVIGPIVKLVRDGIPLETILDTLRSESRRTRKSPIRTWKLWADVVRAALVGQTATGPANGHAAATVKKYSIGPGYDIELWQVVEAFGRYHKIDKPYSKRNIPEFYPWLDVEEFEKSARFSGEFEPWLDPVAFAKALADRPELEASMRQEQRQ